MMAARAAAMPLLFGPLPNRRGLWRSMISFPMVGEPRIPHRYAENPLRVYWGCKYATTILRRHRLFSGDLSGLEYSLGPPGKALLHTPALELVAVVDVDQGTVQLGPGRSRAEAQGLAILTETVAAELMRDPLTAEKMKEQRAALKRAKRKARRPAIAARTAETKGAAE